MAVSMAMNTTMGANLLLVDDNDDVREITALLLRDSGYNVIEVSSGNAALASLDADPAIDLLIVDFAMPGMSGIELLEQARTKRPGIGAVFITGYVDQTWLKGKFADEIVVKKPFTMDELAPAVRKALGRSAG
jgi:CheY-like chemotaxis protein